VGLHNAKAMPAIVHALRQSAVGQSFVYSVPTFEKPHLPQFKDLETPRKFDRCLNLVPHVVNLSLPFTM
jgi:hypothetical protein